MSGPSPFSRRQPVRRVKLTIAYDGTAYHGFQVQPNGVTVQSRMEGVLGILLQEKVRLRAAGRTDAGVHAREQVVDFADSGARSLQTVVRGGNALLPPDIRILEAEEVPPSFDARRHAREKVYRYFLDAGPVPSPFLSRYAWHVGPLRDAEGMQAAIAAVVGRHDFSSFRGQGCTARTAVRSVARAALLSVGLGETSDEAEPPDRTGPSGPLSEGAAAARGRSLRCLDIAGDGFLRHMVRNIAGTLVEIGLGKIPPGRMAEILLLRDRRQAGPTAPARGLFLWQVRY